MLTWSIWTSCPQLPPASFSRARLARPIERVQRSAARFVTGDYRRTSRVSDMCTNLMWNSLYTQTRIRDATMFKQNYHGLMHISFPVIATTAYARTRRQHKPKYEPYQPLARSTSSYSTYAVFHCGMHLPRKLSPHLRISVPECRHPSHPVIDITVDCFSVNHGLPAILFNVLTMLLIYLF